MVPTHGADIRTATVQRCLEIASAAPPVKTMAGDSVCSMQDVAAEATSTYQYTCAMGAARWCAACKGPSYLRCLQLR